MKAFAAGCMSQHPSILSKRILKIAPKTGMNLFFQYDASVQVSFRQSSKNLCRANEFDGKKLSPIELYKKFV
jgi:hypothetical protein